MKTTKEYDFEKSLDKETSSTIPTVTDLNFTIVFPASIPEASSICSWTRLPLSKLLCQIKEAVIIRAIKGTKK